MIKIRILKNKIKNSGDSSYYTPMHVSGMPGNSGVMQMNTMEECGDDTVPDEYGMSSSGNPDLDGDGVYSPAELYYHFDLNQDGNVYPDEYEQHVKWHARNPEVLGHDDQEQKLLPSKSLYEKKDRCYHLAKQKYDVFPSAYASGFIVRCRKGKVGKKKKK